MQKHKFSFLLFLFLWGEEIKEGERDKIEDFLASQFPPSQFRFFVNLKDKVYSIAINKYLNLKIMALLTETLNFNEFRNLHVRHDYFLLK